METLVRGARDLGIPLSDAQVSRFSRYTESLIAGNRKANLTAITDPEEIQIRHYVDSLTFLETLPPESEGALRVLDAGTGAGFPGVPLKIARDSMSLSLMDAVGKKTAFLAELTRELGMDDVTVLTGRAETLAHDPGLRESFDAVVSRYVAPLSVLLEYTLPFCRVGGRIVVQKTASYQEERGDFRRALAELGGELTEERPVAAPDVGRQRRLLVFKKVRPTPDSYPRRPGMPLKRPL